MMTFDEIEERAAAQARADVRQVAVPSFPRPEEMLAPVLRAIGLEGADRQQQNAAWDAYRAELREVEKTRGRGDVDWRQVARGLLDFYYEEGKLTPRALRCERARVVDELLGEVQDQLDRLQEGRAPAVAERLVEEWMQGLERMAQRRKPWDDLGEVLRQLGDGAEAHRVALRGLARVAAAAVVGLHPGGRAAMEVTLADAWHVRCGLAARDNLRRGSAERKAQRAAAEALLHMLRLWFGDGDLSHAVSAWRCTDEALGEAYDGPEGRARRAALRSAIQAALGPELRHAMGLDEPAQLCTEAGAGGSYATAAAHDGDPS